MVPRLSTGWKALLLLAAALYLLCSASSSSLLHLVFISSLHFLPLISSFRRSPLLPPSLFSRSHPLQAIYGGDLEVLELLASTPGVDIHSLNHFGCGAAFWAAAAGNVQTCRFASGSRGHTSVHKVGGKGAGAGALAGSCTQASRQAAWRGHKEALEWMLLDPEGPKLLYQLNMLAADGRDPVQKASVNGHAGMAAWLESLRESELGTLPRG
eukprot:503379-Hanusia_phi.AAC.1